MYMMKIISEIGHAYLTGCLHFVCVFNINYIINIYAYYYVYVYSGWGQVALGAGHMAKWFGVPMYQWCELKSRGGRTKIC